MTIKVEHQGQEITYDEARDVWQSLSLRLEAKSLSALRKKISAIALDASRVDVPVILLRSAVGPASVRPGNLVRLEDDSGWVITKEPAVGRMGVARMVRERIPLSEMSFDDEPTKTAIAAWGAAVQASKVAEAAAKAARAAIPRVTREEALRRGAAPTADAGAAQES